VTHRCKMLPKTPVFGFGRVLRELCIFAFGTRGDPPGCARGGFSGELHTTRHLEMRTAPRGYPKSASSPAKAKTVAKTVPSSPLPVGEPVRTRLGRHLVRTVGLGSRWGRSPARVCCIELYSEIGLSTVFR
jgi:hypothetical protein